MSSFQERLTEIRTPEDLGLLIRGHRKAAGMSQSELAMSSGMALATISAIENGKPNARIGLVLQLCSDLGISLSGAQVNA